MIGIVLVWKVENTFKAAFEVDDFTHYVEIQSEAAIRKLAGHYPYDNFDNEEKKSAMVTNLRMVLCSDKDASPVLNVSKLNHSD